MADNVQQLAFAAIWNNKASEYRATQEEQNETSARIQRAFSNARERGIHIFGRYGCRWSTRRQYFTFWLCPSFNALEESIHELEAAGDFKFADSEHIIGVRASSKDVIDDLHLARDGTSTDQRFGFLAMWRRTNAYFHSSNKERELFERSLSQSFAVAHSKGLRILGEYDCRWSTAWEYFTFCQAPSMEVLDATMENLESVGRFPFFESRHIVGSVEPIFRFGKHLVAEAG